MKSIRHQNFRPIHFFLKHKKFTSNLSFLLILALLNLTTGCSYYKNKKVETQPDTMAEQINKFNQEQKYVVIHSGSNSWHLNNIVIDEDQHLLSGDIDNISALHEHPIEIDKTFKYNKNKSQPLNEVHFFLTNNISPEIGKKLTIPITDIKSISVNDKNTGRSILNVLGTTVGVFALLLIIIAATKSSCPFVYINNGVEFVFMGEIYPGVITANLQRDDYLPLPNFKTFNEEYVLKISNELLEIQHTDLAQLLVVDHDENVEILLDKFGNLHSFSSISSPRNVLVDGIKDNINPSLVKDNNNYLFNTDILNSKSTRELILEFDKPINNKTAKFYLTAKNSMWLDYVYGKFNEQFGNYYPKFQKDQQKAPAENGLKWMIDQHIPLSVYIKTTTGWELVDYINPVGPMATRDIVIPIDLAEHSEDKLIVKLESGFMFWEVDYVGIDYSKNLPLKITTILPSSAIDEKNNDVTVLFNETDKKYFVQPEIGNEVIITYKSENTKTDQNQSVFLKNRGYYNYIRDYDGIPDFVKLQSFKEKNAFTNFSKEQYETIVGLDKGNTVALHDK